VAQAMEDALVLADELGKHAEVEPALAAFMERRLPRARTVVEASVQIARWELARNLGPHLQDTIVRTLTMLCEPA